MNLESLFCIYLSLKMLIAKFTNLMVARKDYNCSISCSEKIVCTSSFLISFNESFGEALRMKQKVRAWVTCSTTSDFLFNAMLSNGES